MTYQSGYTTRFYQLLLTPEDSGVKPQIVLRKDGLSKLLYPEKLPFRGEKM